MVNPSIPHFPPPPPLPARARPFQQVPPAMFPAILGIMGLGMGWRAGHDLFGISAGAAELVLGAASLLFLFGLAIYAVKAMRRPGVVLEDARPIPGRAGLAALTMSLMVLAAVLQPYGASVARVVLYAGFGLHAAYAVYVLVQMLRAPDHLGGLTPACYMVFVGVVVSPLAAIPLGLSTFVLGILVYSTAATLILAALTLLPLLRRSGPAPMRPLHAIHLAPTAMIATGAALAGYDGLALAMLGMASAIFLLLVWRFLWIIEAGFSGFWSGFTFPVAAYAGAWMAVQDRFGWEIAGTTGGVVLVLATLTTPPIALRVLRLWADGTLAARTNAAIA